MIPHNLPTIGYEERMAALSVLSSGWVAQGLEVEAFENELCEFFSIPYGHALAVSSGSAALYLALWVLGGANKRIGLPVYACSALRNAVGLMGGEPVYLDSVEGSPNVDTSAVDLADISILIAPSMFGIPINLSAKRAFKVIEDVAQSFGAISSGERIGLRGDIGICSFYATKMMTSGGQGGALISKDKGLIDKLRDYREFDSRDDAKLRFNFQMTDLQGAIGRAQLKKIPTFIMQRENVFNVYRDAGLKLLDSISGACTPVRYRAAIRCDDSVGLIRSLAENGIGAIVPIEERELLDIPGLYPVAQSLSRSLVSLPCYPLLKTEDALRIAHIAKRFL